MQDIPMFTTQSGVASLSLRNVPYTHTAYVKIQDSLEPEQLLKECCDFCRAVGAERIYASGHAVLERYPQYTTILAMGRAKSGLPETDAALRAVTEQTLEQWRELYNMRMTGVPNASFITLADAQNLLKDGNSYFVHRGETLLGIGIAAGETLDAVISLVPGAGRDVLLALCNALSGDQITLEVASTNTCALRLYEGLGFVKTATVSAWYRLV